ncbi:MAG: carbohydrate-binding domain-containing protein [Kiritimatiellia bacterium]
MRVPFKYAAPRGVLRLILIALCAVWGGAAYADPPVTLSGTYTAEKLITASSDTTINLNGVTFTDCRLKLEGDVTFTLNLVDGTQNSFRSENLNVYCIKATKESNIIITGGGTLDIYSKKKLNGTEGLLTCRNLTVVGGDTKVTFDNDKSDTPCIYLKGNYLQTGGSMKVDSSKKNCTNELCGVYFDEVGTSFTMEGGTFKAEMGGTKSRAISLKKSGFGRFKGGTCKMEFEGPQARFVNGGTLTFEGGAFEFTTNITSKMTNSVYHPHTLSAVKADYSITVTGGDFEADLPLEGSEVFTTDSTTGTFIDISGGTFDLVAGNDCIHARGDINISGGRIRAVSVGDDALDANGGLTISGGDIRAYATAEGTHGLDVNKGKTLTICGGVVIATDGVSAEPIGSGSSTVGKKSFVQPTFYGTVPAADFGSKYLVLDGATNGVAFTVKPRLPDFPAGSVFNLLVSVPGHSASTPEGKSVAEAYSDANSATPLVFEKKALVADHTITTREGDVLTIPPYYDLTPAAGRTKMVTLALNALAAPQYADLATDGVAAITVEGDAVNVSVRTLAGLTYWLRRAGSPDDAAEWADAGAARPGDGAVQTLTVPTNGEKGFFKVRVTD